MYLKQGKNIYFIYRGVVLASEVLVPAILMGGFVKTAWDLFDWLYNELNKINYNI